METIKYFITDSARKDPPSYEKRNMITIEIYYQHDNRCYYHNPCYHPHNVSMSIVWPPNEAN